LLDSESNFQVTPVRTSVREVWWVLKWVIDLKHGSGMADGGVKMLMTQTHDRTREKVDD
jgi:hypothetical protein